ncbi:MAG: hypothetical protein COV59_05450 [Candidatus Magasanikbacteria bacterium CG11_big_fil_rev_8_21_14_0_20_39_34]|uniref:CoA-binding domain-containing protein n=1 Tax=Candidatus Magasanikbacteria bacterium CG11_big_fil_rev_8_21_14_0_20_39_34 TaxID=1974653 RepID=A0A2H0N665_9BACT|nr:MAG: hypothetical protein COV59_05450 [Candidatus Magasanikbacteria bacterium CG11_big_fil_rev_8_21_14_0_20_39_34]
MNSQKCLSNKNIKSFFAPESIAIIGASRKKGKLGNIVLRNLLSFGYKGKIFVVNPRAREIEGVTSFQSCSDLPQIPDLVIISLPATTVPTVLKQVAEKGTKNVVILSAGFSEIGKSGAALEKKIRDISDRYKLHILGPNCLGFLDTENNINATFSLVEKEKGNMRFLSQSGAIASSLFDYAADAGIGFSQFVTLGNKTILNENDFLSFWADEKKTRDQRKKNHQNGFSDVFPVGMYLESISHGEAFVDIVSNISQEDPVFVLKPGQSHAAQKAMLSHTGSLAGEDKIFGAALSASGALRAYTTEDLFDYMRAFSWEKVPQGPRVAILSNAGGPAVISADAVQEAGLELANFSQSVEKKLYKYLPREASVHNPIDILGDALSDRYAKSLELLLKQKNVDAVVVILTPQVMTEIQNTARAIVKLSKIYKKTILCSFMGGSLIHAGEVVLHKHRIPSFRFPERAISVLGKMWSWQMEKKRIQGAQHTLPPKNIDKTHLKWIHDHIESHRGNTFSSIDANDMLSYSGIDVPKSGRVDNFVEVEKFLTHAKFPLVLKISSEELLHKKDIGGVITGIDNVGQLKESFAILKERLKNLSFSNAHIQVQEEIKGGVEVMVGAKRDPNFGTVLLLGAGGTYTELMGEHLVLFPQCGLKEIKRQFENLKIGKLLLGMRGEKSYAIESLYEIVLRLIELMNTFTTLEEIEINPVIVTHQSAWAVDGKLKIIEHTF